MFHVLTLAGRSPTTHTLQKCSLISWLQVGGEQKNSQPTRSTRTGTRWPSICHRSDGSGILRGVPSAESFPGGSPPTKPRPILMVAGRGRRGAISSEAPLPPSTAFFLSQRGVRDSLPCTAHAAPPQEQRSIQGPFWPVAVGGGPGRRFMISSSSRQGGRTDI